MKGRVLSSLFFFTTPFTTPFYMLFYALLCCFLLVSKKLKSLEITVFFSKIKAFRGGGEGGI